MNSNIKNAVVASFIADALSLGVHWVYDTSDIDKKYGSLQKKYQSDAIAKIKKATECFGVQ